MHYLPLCELVEISPTVKLEKGVEYPFVPMEDITAGRRYVQARQIRVAAGGAKFIHGDTLFARITPCLENGKIAQFVSAPGQIAFGSTEYWVFRARPKISDSAFVFYLASTDILRKPAEKSMAGASGRQRADIAAVKNIEVPAPSMAIQCRIASILSAYDDLIENNTRRIAILEEMSRRLYEEWFVRFRFPGHDKLRMVESKLGLIPEGWRIVSASDAIAINPSTKVPKDGVKPFVPMNCLADDSMLISSYELREGNSGSKFMNGDTLFARITPCLENGKTGYVQLLGPEQPVAFGSTEFIILRSRTLTPEFVYTMARSDTFRSNAIKSMSGASGRQRVRDACFNTFQFAHPDIDSLKKFSDAVRPMFKLVQTLSIKNTNLRAQRDLLVPKLISGEIDVSSFLEAEAVTA